MGKYASTANAAAQKGAEWRKPYVHHHVMRAMMIALGAEVLDAVTELRADGRHFQLTETNPTQAHVVELVYGRRRIKFFAVPQGVQMMDVDDPVQGVIGSPIIYPPVSHASLARTWAEEVVKGAVERLMTVDAEVVSPIVYG